MAQQINLFSPLFLQKRKYFSAVTMLQALGLLLGGVLLFYGYALYEVRALQHVANESALQLQGQAAAVARLTQEFSPQGRSRQLEEETARLAQRLRQREQTLALLTTGGQGNAEGFSRYMTALARQTVPGVWLTAVSVAGDEAQLLLTGRAVHPDLVPAYIRVLSREEVMRGRRVAELRLAGREEIPAPATAAPGGAGAGGGAAAAAKPPAAPVRYVEFNISAVRGEAVVPAQSGPPPGAPPPAGAATVPGAPAR